MSWLERLKSRVRSRVGRRRLGLGACVWALASTAAIAPGCHELDTEREAAPKATLGDDIYGMFCDRLGASVLYEDLTGASYHDICHYDGSGNYGGTVDLSVLPPVRGEDATLAREISVGKLEQLAQRRSLLIRAFNGAFPDVDIPNPTTDDPADTVRLHDALVTFSQDITKLYESSPFEGSDPTMPMMTDSFGRLFGAIEENDDALGALERIAGRQGYRPFMVGLGAIRTLLAYPEMRPFVINQMQVMGPDGSAVPELQQMLSVVKRELATSTPTLAFEVPYSVDAATAQPNRPRSAIEVGAAMLLAQHDDFASGPGEPPRFITRRDKRGFVVPLGNTPGVPGSVPTPFFDGDNDGYADVDGLGRFVDASGQPLGLDTPFLIPGRDGGQRDEFMRIDALYDYIDTSRTLLAAVARDATKLVDHNRYAPDGDERPWLSESETLMYSLAGMHLLGGPREHASFDHATEQITPGGSCPPGSADTCTEYERFAGEESPLPDLVHAAGQILAHPESDAIILGVLELLENHEPVVARLMGAALEIKAIADKHDELADQGLEPRAELPYETPIYDQMAQVLSEMVQHEGLIAKLLTAMADPLIVQPHTQDPIITGAPAQHMGEAISAFMINRDKYEYDRQNLNGPSINVTDGGSSYANPSHPVDRTQPLTGNNRSMFEMALQLIYDGNRLKACNKDDAYVYTGILGTYWPLIGSGYTECELMSFDNVGAFYLDSQLPSNHPKRAELVIKPGTLNALMNFIGGFTSQDAFLESASGIDGMTLHPEPYALTRLLFFGANSDRWGQLPDYDSVNSSSNTAKFVEAALEPTGSLVCPVNSNGVATCSAQADLLRMRERGTMMGWYRMGFTHYLKPQLIPFAEVNCTGTYPNVTCPDPNDDTGENFFLDLLSTLWFHWPDADHGAYCDSNTSESDTRYCSGAGANHYEPILGEAMLTDIVPAMHEFAKVATSVNITIERGPRAGQTINGAEVIELLVKLLFDQQYAASVGMTDRKGNAGATWVDGTPQAQVTPFNMFADALRKMDLSFDNSSDALAQERKSKWKRARSQLVDVFMAVESEGPSAKFVNGATTRTLITAVNVLREQLNANCPDRETSGQCEWASRVLGQKLSDTLSRPVFAAMADLTDKVNQHEGARRELEKFLGYALLEASSGDALQGMLASLGDLMQILAADGDFAPIFNAVHVAANPTDAEGGPGCADRTIQVLKAMSDDRYDRYHVLDYVLPAVVTPLDAGAGLTPMEVIVDAIADIHRADARQTTPLDSQDYRFVMKTLREFLTSEFRGFRQLYYIVQNRPKE